MISLQSFKKIALSFPDVVESPHFEKTSFRANKKIFATLDIVAKRGVVKLGEEDQAMFSSHHPNVIYPVKGAWGKQGWTIIELREVKSTIVKSLLAISYQTVNQKKLPRSKKK